MGTTMGTGNVYDDDTETLQYADESGEGYDGAEELDEVDEAREYFAQNALDLDRNPTEADFIRWLVGERLALLSKVRELDAGPLADVAEVWRTINSPRGFRPVDVRPLLDRIEAALHR